MQESASTGLQKLLFLLNKVSFIVKEIILAGVVDFEFISENTDMMIAQYPYDMKQLHAKGVLCILVIVLNGHIFS